MKKLKSLLFNNEMTELARQAERKPKTIVQLLIFVLVFMIANAVGSIPTGIMMGAHIKEITAAVSEAMKAAGQTKLNMEMMSTVTSAASNALLSIRSIHVTMLFVTAITTAIVIIFCTKIEKRPAASMGLTKTNFAKNYLIGLAIGLVMLTAVTLLNVAFGTMEINANANIAKALPMIALYFIGYMLQGMSEEIVCRGYLQMTMSIHNNQIVAILISSFVFAACHLSNNGITVLAFVNIMLYGILMSLMMLRTESIWMVSAVHTAWNFAQGHVFGIAVSGSAASEDSFFITKPIEGASKFINGGNFGVEGGITITLVLIIVIACIVYSVKKPETEEVKA